MNIIHVRPKVGLVANQVLPVTSLPYPTLAPSNADLGQAFRFGKRLGKPRLDQPPARCEVRIVFGQLDHAMQMIGQNHPAVYPEIMAASHGAHSLPQGIDMTDQQIVAMPP